jgi:NlpC/P60 family putative phage cell wall peptidase
MNRAEIVAEAASWIGTPYQHQASLKGAGCDCLGLVRGVWRELYGSEPETAPPYTPDWAETGGGEQLLEAARRHLVERPADAAKPGDVMVFRIMAGLPAKHCGIHSAPGRVIHAYWGHSVTETRLGVWWRRRIAGVFAFPGIED